MLLLALLACSDPAASEAPSGPPPALVEVASVREGALDQPWTLLGEVRALERAELAAAAVGPVVRVTVREGDAVSRGQALLVVDPSLARARRDVAAAQADQARVELERARRDLERRETVKQGVLAEATLDEARTLVESQAARLRALEAATEEAQAQLRRHTVAAPFDGVIAGRHVDPGDWVQVGEPVLDLVSTGAVQVDVEAPLALVGSLQPGHPAVLRGAGEVVAEVVGVVPALDAVSRTARLRVVPRDEAAWLVPGATVDVRLDVSQRGGVVVPRDAVVTTPQGSRVVRVVESSAQPVDVEVLATSGDDALVLAEVLSAGDRVVTRGNERVRPGQPLTVAEP